MERRVALVIPPGWTLHPGGPHHALPLLQGFLQSHSVDVFPFDLNVGVAAFHGVHVSENEVRNACNDASVTAYNDVYFAAEDALERIAQKYSGSWKAHDGFIPADCDLANPHHIREASLRASPNSAYFESEAIPQILACAPAIVGISVSVPSQILSAFELARGLRAHDFTGWIVLGGNVMTRISDDITEPWVFELVNGVTVLQGERTLLDLVAVLEAGASPKDVPNLYWSDGKKIHRNKQQVLRAVDFCGPSFAEIPLSQYWGTPYLTLLGSRGCYYGKCSFCAIPHGWGPKKYIGDTPAQAIAHAMRDARDMYGIERFKFVEEALHPAFVKDLAPWLEEWGLHPRYEAYVRLDRKWADPNFVSLCARTGLIKAYVGLELAPSENRALLTKADSGDPLTILKTLRDNGIKSHVFCMFGYPGTGIEDAVATVEFALRHQNLIDTLDIFSFYYARHTNVEGVQPQITNCNKWAVEYDYIPTEDGVLWPTEVKALADELGDLVWRERPEWFHPVYRMCSPWYESRRVEEDRCKKQLFRSGAFQRPQMLGEASSTLLPAGSLK